MRNKTGSNIINKNDYDLLDKASADLIIANDQWVVTHEQEKNFVEYAIDKNGNEAIYISKKKPYYDPDGNIVGMLCVALDVSDTMLEIEYLRTQQTEKTNFINNMEYLHQFADAFPGNVYWKGLDGIYLGDNKHQKAYFSGIAPTMAGRTLYDFLPYDLAKKIDDHDKEIMRSGKGDTFQETVTNDRDETQVMLSCKEPLRDEHGNIIGLLGFSLNISERIQMEEQLKQTTAQAQAANKAKNDFIMNMSHDLRTPFVGILGFVNVLKNTEQTVDNLEMLNDITTATERLLKIIDELIDLANIGVGEQQSKQKMSIRTLIKNLSDIMTPAAKNKALDLQWIVAKEAPTYFYGNKYAINRVLLNLVGNALKFTEEGFVRIKVEPLAATENNDKMLQIIVEDSGIGIPKNQHDKIFHKYSRGTSSSKRFEGDGLGLYYVKLLVDEMGGDIYVDDRCDKGTRFICKLPMSKGA
ncbi:MAG: PAS domain-containing sensor histidine kinase, partial [Coxiellaceae bacterium]|nr:PAS domain-containing sensor histidine kinase [Coxiellaceae bacterium]